MSLAREVNQPELEREEDCYEEPATREDTPMTIAEEEKCQEAASVTETAHSYCHCYEASAVKTTTSIYGTVGGDNRNKQGLLDCLPDGVDSSSAAINKDTGSINMVRPGSLSYTLQPPTQCQDCVLGVASHIWSFRNKTPTSQGLCHSTDCSSHSTDCTSFSTDCLGLPDKYVLPDVVKELPDVDKMFLLARVGRGIIDSEKTTWQVMPRSPVPEVAGLHAGPRCSQRTGSMD